jgi:hypothetical protein
MSDKSSNAYTATTIVPPQSLRGYLHSEEAMVGILPKVELQRFHSKEDDDGRATSTVDGIALLSVGRIPVSVNLTSWNEGDAVGFSGAGKVAKIAPFSFEGTIRPRDSGSEIAINPAFERLPDMLKRLVSKFETKLIELLQARLEAFHLGRQKAEADDS